MISMESHISRIWLAISIFTIMIIFTVAHVADAEAETKGLILKPIEDGYIDSMSPMVNYAGSNLVVEYFYFRPQNRQRWSFLLFDLTSIPRNSTIESAELYLYALEVHGPLRAGAFRSFDTSWSEGDLYWTLARMFSIGPTSNNTQQITNVAWYHFDVKKDVRDSLPIGRLTLVVKSDYQEGFEYAASAVFYSNDQPGRLNAPRLEVVYTAEAPPLGKQTTAMSLRIDPPGAKVGTDLTISGVLQSDGTPLKEKPVTVEYSLNDSFWNPISTARTDREGRFALNWNPERAGDTKIRVRYEGDESYEGTESLVRFMVESESKPPAQVDRSPLFAVVVAASAVALLLLWRSIGKRREPKPPPQVELRREAAKPLPESPRQIYQAAARRVSTGHKGLDRLLHGGLQPNYAVALTSPSCDEADLLVHRFLEAGLETNNTMLFMTTKLSGELELSRKYPSSFHYIICNPQVRQSDLETPHTYGVRSLDNLTEINLTVIKALEEMEKTLQQKVACVDLVSDILLQHGSAATRQWLLDFTSRMKPKSVTMLATINSQMHPREDLESLLGLFDGQLDLWEEKTEGVTKKFIKIKRMYREPYIDETLPIAKSDLS